MNRASPIIRDLDRAAAIVLAVGLVIFALANGVKAPWNFFAPIFGSFAGQGSAFGSFGLVTTVADICFVVAVALFATARAVGFWDHYSKMPILNWAATARRHRATGAPEPAPEEFESEEEYYERVHPQPQEEATAGTSESPPDVGETAPAGPTWRSRLISLWDLLTEQRVQPTAPVPPVPPTRLLSRGDGPTAPSQPARSPSVRPVVAAPVPSPAPASMPPAPLVRPTAAASTSIADNFEPDFFASDGGSVPAPASGPTDSEDHDFASDPDFRAGATAGPADNDDFWPPEEST